MKKSRILSSILAVVMLGSVGVMTACNKSSNAANYPTSATGTPVQEAELHYWDETKQLHNVNVTEGTNVFIENGVSNYKILDGTGGSNVVLPTVRTYQALINREMSVMVELSTDAWNADEYFIVLNDKTAFQSAGLTMPSADLEVNGYHIKSKGKTVFIMAQNNFGVANGLTELMYHTFGYEYFATETYTWTPAVGDKVMMPEFDITDRPDYMATYNSNQHTIADARGWKTQKSDEIFAHLGGGLWHNAVDTLDPEIYGAAHPKWYSTANKDGDPNKWKQLCMTARGDSAELDAMVQEVARLIIEAFNTYTDQNIITFSIMDEANKQCKCSSCQAGVNKYGAESGNHIAFLNKVAPLVIKEFPDRNVKILFFAYQYTEQPPTCSTSVLKCHDNVGVYFAPIHAHYNKSFYDNDNAVFAQRASEWGKYTKNFCLWLYETNFTNYLYPLDSYDTMIESFRFFKNNNGIFMYPEGQYNQPHVTAFGKLKEYLNAKATWNVNISFKDICDKYFPAMFREAAPIMRQYFEELQIRCKANASLGDDGTIYAVINDGKFWPMGQLLTWKGYIDKALDAVAHYQTTDPDLYKKLERNIKLEKVFIQYALIDLYYFAIDAKTERADFVKLCQDYNIKYLHEVELLDKKFATWES